MDIFCKNGRLSIRPAANFVGHQSWQTGRILHITKRKPIHNKVLRFVTLKNQSVWSKELYMLLQEMRYGPLQSSYASYAVLCGLVRSCAVMCGPVRSCADLCVCGLCDLVRCSTIFCNIVRSWNLSDCEKPWTILSKSTIFYTFHLSQNLN